jgi:hypothetical protein
MNIVTRSAWGARAPKYINRGHLKEKSTGHWNGPTVTIGGKLEWNHDRCAGLVRGIQNFHMDSRGWADIAYNFVICPHGTIYEGRGLNIYNGANGTNSGNRSSHAIMWLSGQNNPFTEAERVAFRNCVKYIADSTNAPNAAIGHRDHKSTECPGDARYNWIRQGMHAHGPAPSLPPPVINQPILKLGSKGPAVERVQRIIRDKAGGDCEVDGTFGNQTRRRVRDLQRFFGLKDDGIVGKDTWKVLNYLDAAR